MKKSRRQVLSIWNLKALIYDCARRAGVGYLHRSDTGLYNDILTIEFRRRSCIITCNNTNNYSIFAFFLKCLEDALEDIADFHYKDDKVILNY